MFNPEQEPTAEEITAATDILKLISDPTRLKILWALLHGEHPVGELAEHVGVKQTVVSQHLAKLKIAHLVSVRRDGNRMFYHAENEHVQKLIEQALSQATHIVKGI